MVVEVEVEVRAGDIAVEVAIEVVVEVEAEVEVAARAGDSAEVAVVVEAVVESEVAIGMQIKSHYVRDPGHVVASFPLVFPLVSISFHESYPNPVSVMQKADLAFSVLPSR